MGSDQVHIGKLLKNAERIGQLPKSKQDKIIRDFIGSGIDQIALAFEHLTLPTAAQFITVIQQASNLDWDSIRTSLNSSSPKKMLSLDRLASIDNMSIDRAYGVCPIPMYELTQDEWDLFNSSSDFQSVREKLEQMGVFQYFFPSSDELAVGFVDRGLKEAGEVKDAIKKTNDLGHLAGPNTIVEAREDFVGMLSELKEAGLLAEGEFGYEITGPGATFRSSVKVRPKEGAISKVLNRFNVNFNPADLIK